MSQGTVREKQLPGKVTKITGPLSYVIELSDGNTVCRHVDHIKARENDQDDVQNPECDDTNWDYVDTNSSQSTELSTDNNTTESTLHHSDLINLLDTHKLKRGEM